MQMSIHIRGTVEFEKLLSEPWQSSIEMTRSRMAVQQLLDTQESKPNLERRLQDYIKKTDVLIDYLAKKGTDTLIEHPTFEWSVNDSIIRSPCWRLESILPRYTLSVMSEKHAIECVKEHNYKEARKLFLTTIDLHTQCVQKLLLWKWKLPSLNHDVLQKKWHLSKIEIFTGMATLCMLSTGIQKHMKSSALFTVTQRALRNFSRSLATWPSKQSQDLMHITEAMRYYFSSDILWSAGHYGQSIHRLERWMSSVEFGPFELLRDEWTKVTLLLEERYTTNNGAYFDPLSAATPLCTPVELINSPAAIDIPHPPMKQALDDVHEDVSTPTVFQET